MTHGIRCLVLVSLIGGCRTTEPTTALEERSPARVLLERSLEHHDPDRIWGRKAIPVSWTSTRPDGRVGFALEIEFGPGGDLSMRGERAGKALEYRVEDDVVWARVDGEENLTDEERNQMGLIREDGLFWRNYLGFLAGMPMCLTDPGVSIDPEVTDAKLDGRTVRSIRACFAPEVGTDIWTFYFDPETASLLGCRFDKADPTKDGETLVFEGTTSVAGLRLPRERRWYMNADRRFLGTDELR